LALIGAIGTDTINSRSVSVAGVTAGLSLKMTLLVDADDRDLDERDDLDERLPLDALLFFAEDLPEDFDFDAAAFDFAFVVDFFAGAFFWAVFFER
jgi:hypothetical protein